MDDYFLLYTVYWPSNDLPDEIDIARDVIIGDLEESFGIVYRVTGEIVRMKEAGVNSVQDRTEFEIWHLGCSNAEKGRYLLPFRHFRNAKIGWCKIILREYTWMVRTIKIHIARFSQVIFLKREVQCWSESKDWNQLSNSRTSYSNLSFDRKNLAKDLEA